MAKTPNWSGYLADFHEQRAGAIEAVLARSLAGDHNPYRWLARAVSSRADTVVDVACGSGPVARELGQNGRTVIGVDISAPELQLARRGGPVALGDARRLPLGDGVADVAVSSMGLAVISPAATVLAEMARVLRPGGMVVLLGPTVRPMMPSDAREVALLTGAMRTRVRFPGVLERIGLSAALPAVGLTKVEDARERYRFTVNDRADAELLLSALYLPYADPAQVAAGVAHLERRVAARGPVALPIPMRRVLAIK